ncbi:MAG: hypothetical protein COZ28_01855 [Candidatus Moranbacteria bacterium CG_4_10_14_3_um_filter_44_15]|nr:MAG: hypothetical protein COS72_03080 [Candidatus Moranbacteria bacterium CG06_land_8_20_14_3_00_43_56]PIV84527.1 MAG: hypothetical protein COW51_00015 [Candidatus Moranbacteria bacterium CG17_big_fil_post_rev_8_21_14_2_50_44_12]PIW93156.1 MAG: hypothetical protein COZ87_02840 [Candidatus Moranbacteria bacterium CG_4_8_14_3_um_filter_43_15]PIX90783.1 MAG: hypothetical protein COZ28_01855 [Candidatus Moranbacteria bacterium CG_4_10_14_3_um_filter_44_15]PJA86247.1 MAG: hypothetical protein CO1
MHLGRYDNSPSRKFFWLFVLLVTIVAIVVISLTLARATIIIHPKIEKKSNVISLAIDAKALKPGIANGILPGRIMESQGEITKDISDVSLRKTEDFAKGTVKIKNIWKKDFFLQKGAQLVQSESPEAVGLDPKNIFLLDNDTVAIAEGEVTASITAKNKGLTGNIDPGKFYFLRMSQWNRERIWAENEENFSGGEIETKVVSADDIARATQFTAEELGKQEIEKLKNQIPADSKLSPALTRVEILESRASVAPETTIDNFQMFVRGKVSSIVYNEKDLKDTAVEKFKEQISANQEISEIDEKNIKYELSDISGMDGKADVKISIPAILTPKLPSKMLDKKAIIGYNEAALRERYAKFTEIESIEVKFFPFWVKSVPSFEGQVGFEIRVE